MIRPSEEAVGKTNVTLYQLKVVLKWSKPAIWRRVIVRSDITLARFHKVLQIAMGWTDSHLHHFIVGQTIYGRPDPEFADMGTEVLNEKRYTVADVAPAVKKKFVYEYDFGDSWVHQVLVEKIVPGDSAFKHPACIAGENAGPPEDCGGIHGYYNLLKVLADPNNPEHVQLRDWIGGEWDATRFDLGETNNLLKRLKA